MSPFPTSELIASRTITEVEQALIECEDYFDQRADAEYFTDSPSPVGNKEMHLLMVVRDALKALGRTK